MRKKIVVSTAALALVGTLLSGCTAPANPAAKINPAALAGCLTKRQVTMYGAAWCSHCQAQKQLFGTSTSALLYVECPDNPQRCTQAGIESYPTWVLPDGRRLVGQQSLEVLARESGCLAEAQE